MMTLRAFRVCLYSVQILLSFVCLLCSSIWLGYMDPSSGGSGGSGSKFSGSWPDSRGEQIMRWQAQSNDVATRAFQTLNGRRALLYVSSPSPAVSAASFAAFTALISLVHTIFFLTAAVRPSWGSRVLGPLTRIFKNGSAFVRTAEFVELLAASILAVFWFAAALVLTVMSCKPGAGQAAAAFAWLALLTWIAYEIVMICTAHRVARQQDLVVGPSAQAMPAAPAGGKVGPDLPHNVPAGAVVVQVPGLNPAVHTGGAAPYAPTGSATPYMPSAGGAAAYPPVPPAAPLYPYLTAGKPITPVSTPASV